VAIIVTARFSEALTGVLNRENTISQVKNTSFRLIAQVTDEDFISTTMPFN